MKIAEMNNLIAGSHYQLNAALATIRDNVRGIASESVIETAETVEEHIRAAGRLRVDIRNVGALLAAMHDAAKAHETLAIAKEFGNGGEA